jgi:hypothetical protein
VDGALQSFDEWINGVSPWLLAAALALTMVTLPLWAFVHELGHAAVALVRTQSLVVVEVGRRPARWRRRLGRLELRLNPIPGRNATGRAYAYGRLGVGSTVAVALAGPLAQAAASALLLALAVVVDSSLLELVGAVAMGSALVQLVPFEHAGTPSDGKRALLAFARAPSVPRDPRELAATRKRWLAVFSDPESPRGTALTKVWLARVPAWLGYPAGLTDARTVALVRLARAGWCWREVERGEPQRLDDAVARALDVVASAGVVGHERTAAAANELVAGGVELGLGSPGAGDVERVRFLAGAFTGLPGTVGSRTVPVEQEQFAFRYGVAVHDVERVQAGS